MKTCAFITLGCKVNQYETQAIRESLAADGYRETSPEGTADLYIINTCTVTSLSDEKSRQYIRKVKRTTPDAVVVVTGCYAESDPKAIKTMEGVDYVITKSDEGRIAEIIRNGTAPSIGNHETQTALEDAMSRGNHPSPALQSKQWEAGRFSSVREADNSIYNLKISRFAGHTKAFLKIEDGCDMYCSYCIIPYIRGGIKSRSPRDVREEAERLVQNGYKEIILTGIHLGAYGKETHGGGQLTDIISMLSNMNGLKRLRLSSIEVNEITGELISLLATNKKVCPHFHIPLQSGNDLILKRMNRKYTSSYYLEVMDAIRSQIHLPSFTTDVMVGFPGEEEAHFTNTLEVCRKAGFSRMHIFSFSPRKGTPAAEMPDQCPPQMIKQRKTQLEDAAHALAFAYKKQLLHTRADVLVERERDPRTNKLCGYSERYVKVLFDGPDALKTTVVSVRIEEVAPAFAVGKLL